MADALSTSVGEARKRAAAAPVCGSTDATSADHMPKQSDVSCNDAIDVLGSRGTLRIWARERRARMPQPAVSGGAR